MQLICWPECAQDLGSWAAACHPGQTGAFQDLQGAVSQPGVRGHRCLILPLLPDDWEDVPHVLHDVRFSVDIGNALHNTVGRVCFWEFACHGASIVLVILKPIM